MKRREATQSFARSHWERIACIASTRIRCFAHSCKVLCTESGHFDLRLGQNLVFAPLVLPRVLALDPVDSVGFACSGRIGRQYCVESLRRATRCELLNRKLTLRMTRHTP